MFAFLFALALLACIVLALIAARARADARRLGDRLDRTDAQSLASLDVDSFGTLDGIAAVALFIAITRVEQLEQMRREFIADFSHEARTPLAALRSAVDTFEAGNVGADDDQQLRRIMARQIGRLERLVADLAELSQIEAGGPTPSPTDGDLRPPRGDRCPGVAGSA